MKPPRSCSVAVCLLALTMIASAAGAREIDERQWILMESENFSVYSSVNRRKTEDLLLHLETLRAVFVNYLGFGANLNVKTTKILVVGRQSDYRDLGLSIETAGRFSSNLRNNNIIIRNAAGMDEDQIILHEYIHFLVNATDRFPFPLWWHEGFAEFASATRLTRSTFDIGLPLNGRINTLNFLGWLQWEDVVAAKSTRDFGNYQASFYAQAWLLVHYLQTQPSNVNLNQRWSDYAEALSEGANQTEAFTQAFGMSIDELERRIEQYAGAGRFQIWRIPLEAVELEFEPIFERVSRQDIQVQLGHFTFANGDYEAARSWFDKAVENQTDDPAAYAGRARAMARLGLYEEARAEFEQVREMDTQNALALVDYAIFEIENAWRDDVSMSDQEYDAFLDAAETLLSEARSIAGGSVEIDTYLAYIWMRRDATSIPAMQLLESVVERSPSDLWPALMLTECLALNGRADEALELANAVARYDHGRSSYYDRALEMIRRIEASTTSD